jgi:hypothetical protein
MGIVGHKGISGMFRKYEVFQERWQNGLTVRYLSSDNFRKRIKLL